MDLHVDDENVLCFAEARYIFITITVSLKTFTENWKIVKSGHKN